MSQHIGPRTISAIGGSIKRVGPYRIHTFPSELVTDGLVLNLDAGDPRSYPSSGTTWTDLSGNGNNGTISGATYSNADGGSLVFNGVDDDVTTQFYLNPGNPFTVECWFKLDVIKEWHNLCDAFLDSSNRNFQMFVGGGGTFEVFWKGANPSGGSISGTVANQVYYGVFAYDGNGSTGNLYRYGNGTFNNSTVTIPVTGSFSSQLFSIGKRGDNSPQGFTDGNIYSVKVYNRALSAAEVAQNYDALRVRYGSYTSTFTPICAGGEGKVEVLCVAGGGGGGIYENPGGGGGAGGLLYNSAFSVNSNSLISVSVGSGGRGGIFQNVVAQNGGNSSFSSLTSIGGGKGSDGSANGSDGGSGGGGNFRDYSLGGNGTTGQGNNGGNGDGHISNTYTTGGGGGAGSKGQDGLYNTYSGNGGSGLSYSISGTSQFYAGGGGGGKYIAGNAGLGGSGIGGNGGSSTVPGSNAIPNTGSGGGGGSNSNAGNGANGTVIVRYPATDYNVEVLVVGGGGGGGLSVGSGGGAGGLLYYSSYPISAGTKYTVTVGSGGAGSSNTALDASNGNNSVFGSLIAYGGGGGTGQSVNFPNGTGGKSGGSGSGGSRNQITPGNGISGQGNRGGFGSNAANAYGGGGGGGAGGVGGDGSGTSGGNGGIGLAYSIGGSSTYYAGGGGGSSNYSGVGTGGLGGGGNGSITNGLSATANTGGGGGGGDAAGGGTTGGNGGSGVVIIAYKGPQRGIGGVVDTTSRPGYTLHKFTTTGTDFFIP